MNDYVKMLERHQEELAQFPIVYAFGQEQFEKAMQKLGLEASDTEEVCSIFGAGDIIRKSDAPKFLDLLKKTPQRIAGGHRSRYDRRWLCF